VCEEGLEAPVLDDDAILVLAHGCTRLRSLALLHCGGVTDAGASALACRCKALQVPPAVLFLLFLVSF
jgi:hypothetical protein